MLIISFLILVTTHTFWACQFCAYSSKRKSNLTNVKCFVFKLNLYFFILFKISIQLEDPIWIRNCFACSILVGIFDGFVRCSTKLIFCRPLLVIDIIYPWHLKRFRQFHNAPEITTKSKTNENQIMWNFTWSVESKKVEYDNQNGRSFALIFVSHFFPQFYFVIFSLIVEINEIYSWIITNSFLFTLSTILNSVLMLNLIEVCVLIRSLGKTVR